MTIIDTHTHTFPDKIADKTISLLEKKGNVRAYRKGTLDALKESMKKSGIDYSVVLPVATKASQVDTINKLSAEINGVNNIYFAGAIHPDSENIEEILDYIKSIGLFGIKIHPDYQGVRFDDERYIRIMKAAAQRDLITVTHAGIDVGYPDDIHCTPDMVLNVLDKLKGIIDNKLVLAHMGGFGLAGEVLDKLIGKPVYMDTAAVLSYYPYKCREIIKRHGADKILFATDSPWANQKEFVDIINSMDFTSEELEKIFYKNAAELMKIKV